MEGREDDAADAADWRWPALVIVALALAVLVLPPLGALRGLDAMPVESGVSTAARAPDAREAESARRVAWSARVSP